MATYTVLFSIFFFLLNYSTLLSGINRNIHPLTGQRKHYLRGISLQSTLRGVFSVILLIHFKEGFFLGLLKDPSLRSDVLVGYPPTILQLSTPFSSNSNTAATAASGTPSTIR